MRAPAVDSRLELPTRRQTGNVQYGIGPIGPVRAIASSARHGAGHQTVIVAPVDAEPRPLLPRLVLRLSGLVKIIVGVDAELLGAELRIPLANAVPAR